MATTDKQGRTDQVAPGGGAELARRMDELSARIAACYGRLDVTASELVEEGRRV